MAKVVDVNISEKKGVPKHPVDEIECILKFGIKGDAHGGDWHRQISLLGVESIEIMKKMGVEGLGSGKFAENITTEGIELYKLPVGTRLKINEVVLEVTQIGKECHNKCEIFQKVGKCIMPTQGIFAVVIKEGKIKAGDNIEVL